MNRLWFKLTAAFLLVAIMVVSLIAIMANRITSSGFQRFLSEDRSDQASPILDDLAAYYNSVGGWEGVEVVLQGYLPGRGAGGGGVSYIVIDSRGETIAIAGGGRGRARSEIELADPLPITVGGQQVGGLIIDEPGAMGSNAAEQYLDEVNQVLLVTALAAVVLASLVGAFLARSLTRPLGQLTEATRAVAAGDLNQQVSVESNDEIGELAESFNHMAGALAANEVERHRLFADIAHELRTPISIIRGQLEGMQDGVVELSSENLGMVHEETVVLGKLVEDLRTLSMAESGQLPLDMQSLDIGQQAKQAVVAFRPLAEADGIDLVLDVSGSPTPVAADPARIQQVFGNLLSNAFRHAGRGSETAAQVRVVVEGSERFVRVTVQDNGPGIPADAQSRVFDRFWRADSARNRDEGGSGLGLAICKGIIDAHHGRIWVESRPGSGASFCFELPVSGSSTRPKIERLT